LPAALILSGFAMVEFLRAIFLSFCPESVRRRSHSLYEPQLSRIAVVTGAVQAVLSMVLLGQGFFKYFFAQNQQWGYHLVGAHNAVQALGLYLIIAQYLLHPISIILAYLVLEGGIRIFAALLVNELIPSLPVVIFFKLLALTRRQKTVALRDAVDVQKRYGVIMISSAAPKDTWTGSLVLAIKGPGIQEGWYELERKYLGSPPRPYVYIFHPAPSAKILRGYEEYDTTGSEKA
jgi:hypothetical protein